MFSILHCYNLVNSLYIVHFWEELCCSSLWQSSFCSTASFLPSFLPNSILLLLFLCLLLEQLFAVLTFFLNGAGKCVWQCFFFLVNIYIFSSGWAAVWSLLCLPEFGADEWVDVDACLCVLSVFCFWPANLFCLKCQRMCVWTGMFACVCVRPRCWVHFAQTLGFFWSLDETIWGLWEKVTLAGQAELLLISGLWRKNLETLLFHPLECLYRGSQVKKKKKAKFEWLVSQRSLNASFVKILSITLHQAPLKPTNLLVYVAREKRRNRRWWNRSLPCWLITAS